MGKKSKSKTTSSPEQKQKENDVKQLENKPSSKKRTSEIDEIFAAKKRKKIDHEKTQKPVKGKDAGGAKMKEKKRPRRKEEDDKSRGFWESDSRPRKKTQDGIAVYTEEELGLNKADAGAVCAIFLLTFVSGALFVVICCSMVG
ncbi:hypothetical protein F8388_018206 [Cannabis sativa]|uniref:Uncharacterized protein n=1 Tax=Cannabis sativa TaxID=3483 RepID=A0A7J6GBA5_CANSA|nr:hypothetical protein F8388_018206 [Cannabis sativa]